MIKLITLHNKQDADRSAQVGTPNWLLLIPVNVCGHA